MTAGLEQIMALRNQPYLPLYVQDVLTDEKLIECSAEAHGVYFRLLCILHKQQEYGRLFLKEKYFIGKNTYENFAHMLVKQMPFDFKTIASALKELSEEEVITVEDTELFQKRMVRDALLSEKRSQAGRKGADSTNSQYFAAANDSANTTSNASANESSCSPASAESESESDIEGSFVCDSNLHTDNEEDTYSHDNDVENESLSSHHRSAKEDALEQAITDIIVAINRISGKRFNAKTKAARAAIRARLSETGYTIEDVEHQLQILWDCWKGTTGSNGVPMENYFCPDTIFRPSNFEKYMNFTPRGQPQAVTQGGVPRYAVKKVTTVKDTIQQLIREEREKEQGGAAGEQH